MAAEADIKSATVDKFAGRATDDEQLKHLESSKVGE